MTDCHHPGATELQPYLHCLTLTNQSFILKTDTSRSRVGVVVSQAKHPIAFFKNLLSMRLLQQSANVRELHSFFFFFDKINFIQLLKLLLDSVIIC